MLPTFSMYSLIAQLRKDFSPHLLADKLINISINIPTGEIKMPIEVEKDDKGFLNPNNVVLQLGLLIIDPTIFLIYNALIIGLVILLTIGLGSVYFMAWILDYPDRRRKSQDERYEKRWLLQQQADRLNYKYLSNQVP